MRNPRTFLGVSLLEKDAPPTAERTPFAQLLQRMRPEMLRFALWLARDGALAEHELDLVAADVRRSVHRRPVSTTSGTHDIRFV